MVLQRLLVIAEVPRRRAHLSLPPPTRILPFQLRRQSTATPRRETPSVVPRHVHHRTVQLPLPSIRLGKWVSPFTKPAIYFMPRIECLVHPIRHRPFVQPKRP